MTLVQTHMKTLTLIRHAKSSWSNHSLADHERPLNHRGMQDAPAMGQRLAQAGVSPQHIISSTAVRAWTTAQIIAEKIAYPEDKLQSEAALYMASLNDIIDVIAAQNASSLMLFGHNPGFTEFANHLVPGITGNLPTAGVVSVALRQDDWNLYTRPDAKLLLYDFPKNSR